MYAQQPGPEPVTRRLGQLWASYQHRRGQVLGSLILMALIAFEIFNFTTTDYALTDLLGDVSFFGVRWAVLLAIAFCGMDFAGIARLFTPEREAATQTEVWYLLGAWFLAASMNALLTWWGVSIALLSHEGLGNEILNRQDLLTLVPMFMAILVVLIRVLIIGTFSIAGDRLFTQRDDTVQVQPEPRMAQSAMRGVTPPPQPRRLPEDDWDYEPEARPRPHPQTRPAPEPPRATSVPPQPVRPPSPSPVRPAPKPMPKPMPHRPEENGRIIGSDFD